MFPNDPNHKWNLTFLGRKTSYKFTMRTATTCSKEWSASTTWRWYDGAWRGTSTSIGMAANLIVFSRTFFLRKFPPLFDWPYYLVYWNRGACSLPLHIACLKGYEDAVELLLKHGARVDVEARMCWPGPHQVGSTFTIFLVAIKIRMFKLLRHKRPQTKLEQFSGKIFQTTNWEDFVCKMFS